ncbi:MAG: hypothetical protein OES46_09765 [Gammaproteobacteria bacterium]|nr:hypothetical protein [Gammaproteobacteria bacterium]
MDVDEKYPGYTHIALAVGSLAVAKEFMKTNAIAITGSFMKSEMLSAESALE